MRVAALYDIHGNLPALEAALADVDELGVDVILIGGDIASGPMPAETLHRLLALGDRARFIRGNADRDSEEGDVDDIWTVRGAWAMGRLSPDGRAFVARLPAQAVLHVDGLGSTLFCHGSPRSDEEIITEATAETRLRPMLSSVQEDVVVCGHTHMQFDRPVAGKRVVNAGSVGMPYEGQPGAYWALLGPDVELRRSDYDIEDAADRIRASGYPDADEHVDSILRDPPPKEDAIEFFERMAAERARSR